MPELRKLAPGITVEIAYWHDRAFDDLAAGTVDLLFSPLATPSIFHVEQLFEDKFVCLLGRNHPFKRRTMTLDDYLKSEHVSVETQPKQQNLIDRSLAEAGLRRKVVLHLPYIITSVLALKDTDLVLTTPARVVKEVLGRYDVRQIAAPGLISAIQYSMVWHPRLEREELHAWFRGLVQSVCGQSLTK